MFFAFALIYLGLTVIVGLAAPASHDKTIHITPKSATRLIFVTVGESIAVAIIWLHAGSTSFATILASILWGVQLICIVQTVYYCNKTRTITNLRVLWAVSGAIITGILTAILAFL